MVLEQRFNTFDPPQFNLPTNTVLGTTQRWSIDRTWPIEEIVIYVHFDVTTSCDNTGNTLTSPAFLDGILGIIGKINLSVNDGRQPRSVVDCSGIGLLEYVSQVGWNLDRSTLKLVERANTSSATALAAASSYMLTYRIPCAPCNVGEPLRTRMYLPVHTYPQDPVLTLTFNTVAQMGYASGALSATGSKAIRVGVQLIRRLPTLDSEKKLRATAGSNPSGYIDWDLIETPFQVPLSSGAEQRFPIPVPGNYMELLFRQYRGNSIASGNAGANYLRAPIDGDATTTQGVTDVGLGNENVWRLETGLVSLRQWRWQQLRAMNDWNRPLNTIAGLTTSPSFEAAATNTGVILAGSTMHNFLTDGLTGDTGNELGSLLDCNTPANNGLKMEIVGTPKSVTVQPHTMYMMGRRLFGDISRWQAL